jgi:hypothetical protein
MALLVNASWSQNCLNRLTGLGGPKDQFNSLSGEFKLVASPYPRRSKSMDLQDVLEQLSTATRSLKLSASWLESQSDDQIREIGSGDWLPLSSAVHDLEERVIQVDRVFNRGEEARLDLGRDLIEPEPSH